MRNDKTKSRAKQAAAGGTGLSPDDNMATGALFVAFKSKYTDLFPPELDNAPPAKVESVEVSFSHFMTY
jgi:hypothetical protein